MMRLRFAPSPTGNLHIGSVRTALFNWLLAKANRGTFILRIEDTDKQRSSPEFESNILKGMKWLGLTWDEGPEINGNYGPYRQSDRLTEGIYHRYLSILLKQGLAYPCFCESTTSDESIDTASDTETFRGYNGHCRHLTNAKAQQRISRGEPYCIRFKVIPELITVYDLIRGNVTFDMSLLGDLVIMKRDGSPSYNFAVVVDDLDMKITHVIRGEDHLSNTPKQIQLFQAFNVTPPAYGHLSMILGSDHAKLSKRHGATAVSAYQEQGFLPEAILNFLALLGWSHPENKEKIPLEELIQLYSLDRVVKHNTIFDSEKLKWLNSLYVREKTGEALYEIASKMGLFPESSFNHEKMLMIIESVREKLILLTDLSTKTAVFFASTIKVKEQVQSMTWTATDHLVLKTLTAKIKNTCNLTIEISQNILDDLSTSLVLKKSQILHPIRLAITGEASGPPLKYLFTVFGCDEIVNRLTVITDVLPSLQ